MFVKEFSAQKARVEMSEYPDLDDMFYRRMMLRTLCLERTSKIA